MFAGSQVGLADGELLSAFLLTVLLSAAGFTDWHSRRIPNRLILLGLVWAFILNSLIPLKTGPPDALAWRRWAAMGEGVFGSLSGGLFLGGLHLVPYLLRGMGAGDVKLAFLIGFWLKPKGCAAYLGCYALVLAVCAAVLLLAGRKRPASLPLAPFMALACLLYVMMYIQ